MSGQSGEVVTLQLGHYANCVGAHWWNLQKAEFSQSQDSEICSDVLFRRGVTLQGAETYTPRLIALDLREHICSVRESNTLHEDGDERQCVPAWRGEVSVHTEGSSTRQGDARTPASVHDKENGRLVIGEQGAQVLTQYVATLLRPLTNHREPRLTPPKVLKVAKYTGLIPNPYCGHTDSRSGSRSSAPPALRPYRVSQALPVLHLRPPGSFRAGGERRRPLCYTSGLPAAPGREEWRRPLCYTSGEDPGDGGKALPVLTQYFATLRTFGDVSVGSLCDWNVDGLEFFSQGEATFRSQLEEIEDRLHFFIEECDYLQGFQLLCDVHNGFSGVGARMVELLHDEYPGRGILSFGMCPVPSSRKDPCKALHQLMNCVLALGPLSNYSSLFCPLSLTSSLGRRPGAPTVFPQLLYDASVQYQSSAVLAVVLNTLTVPYRMSSGLSMSHHAEVLTFGGRKVLAAACAVPFPLSSAMSLPDALLPHRSGAPWCSVSACGGAAAAAAAIFSQLVVLRGLPELCHNSNLLPGRWPQSSLHARESGQQVLQQYLCTLYPQTHSMTCVLGATCALSPTFPQFFSPYVTKDGFTVEEPQSTPPVVGHIPVLGALQTTSALEQMLCSLCDELSMAVVRRWMNFSIDATEQDDFRGAEDDIRNLAHNYRAREG